MGAGSQFRVSDISRMWARGKAFVLSKQCILLHLLHPHTGTNAASNYICFLLPVRPLTYVVFYQCVHLHVLFSTSASTYMCFFYQCVHLHMLFSTSASTYTCYFLPVRPLTCVVFYQCVHLHVLFATNASTFI